MERSKAEKARIYLGNIEMYERLLKNTEKELPPILKKKKNNPARVQMLKKRLLENQMNLKNL